MIKHPGKAALELYKGLPKPYTSVIMQLRSERSALNHYLFKVKQHPDSWCTCWSQARQTPQHVLLTCERWQAERAEIMTKIAARTDVSTNASYDQLVSDPKAVRYVAEFMLKTGLLGQFREVQIDPEPPEAPETREPSGIPG